jgi:hypothetical protein
MAYRDTNNITFNTFDGDSFARGKKVSNSQYLGATVDDLADIASDNGGKLPTIVNAVEIDWNGAVLPNSNTSFGTSITINTTSEIFRGTLRGN